MEIFLLWVLCAIVSAVIASSKGRSAFGWFILGMLISVFAIVLVAVLPSKKKSLIVVAGEVATPETHVRCPYCKGLVRKEASVCMHCKNALKPITE